MVSDSAALTDTAKSACSLGNSIDKPELASYSTADMYIRELALWPNLLMLALSECMVNYYVHMLEGQVDISSTFY